MYCFSQHSHLFWVYGVGQNGKVVGGHDKVEPNLLVSSGQSFIRHSHSSILKSYIHFLNICCCNVWFAFKSNWSFSDLKFHYRLIIATAFFSCRFDYAIKLKTHLLVYCLEWAIQFLVVFWYLSLPMAKHKLLL